MPTPETLRKILTVLAEATSELYTRQIIELTGLSHKTVSAALLDLQRSHWVKRRWQADYRYYQLTEDGRAHLATTQQPQAADPHELPAPNSGETGDGTTLGVSHVPPVPPPH